MCCSAVFGDTVFFHWHWLWKCEFKPCNSIERYLTTSFTRFLKHISLDLCKQLCRYMLWIHTSIIPMRPWKFLSLHSNKQSLRTQYSNLPGFVSLLDQSRCINLAITLALNWVCFTFHCLLDTQFTKQTVNCLVQMNNNRENCSFFMQQQAYG